MQPFQPNEEQLEALNNGATMLWIPIPPHAHVNSSLESIDNNLHNRYFNTLIKVHSPLHLGKQYFVQEKFIDDPSQIVYKADFSQSNQDLEDWLSANQMQEHQSRTKFTVTNIEVKIIKSLLYKDMPKLGITYSKDCVQLDDSLGEQCYSKQCSLVDNLIDWYNKQYPDKPYSTNPYGFLITIKLL